MALSETQVKAAKAAEKAYRLKDARGLFLWVTPAGGRLWRWGYLFQGKEKLMTFGGYPDVPLASARLRHEEARRLLAAGIDPMAQRKEEKVARQRAAADSFEVVAKRWLAHWRVGKSPRYAALMERRMQANLYPLLGARPISLIEAPELVAMAQAMDRRGVPELARRSLETCGQIFRYAIAHGLAQRSPAADFKPSDVLTATMKRNQPRIPARELPALLRAINLYPGRHGTRLAMILMTLTFVRTSELIGARWEEFDLARGRWDIPAERMKMSSEHIVPLARQAVAALKLLKQLAGDAPWVFPGGNSARRHLSNGAILQALKRMGYRGQMTGHGFRGVASTLLHEQGWPHEHIELQLAHVPRNAVSAAYNHALYLAPRTVMMQAWADFLDAERERGA